MPYEIPIKKGIDLKQLEPEQIINYHDNLHIMYGKIEDGTDIYGWSFHDLYMLHKEIIYLMLTKGLHHVFPVNSLDILGDDYFEQNEEKNTMELNLSLMDKKFSVEEKLNGFHVSIHKKGNIVKIFSEQKKELSFTFNTLINNILKLSEDNFVIDGELVPYDSKGNTLGRNELMKYIGSAKSGKQIDDSNINLHIWDILFLNKNLIEMPLSERISYLNKMHFNDRVLEVKRKIVNLKNIINPINEIVGIKGSEGAVIKDIESKYIFGENPAWKKFRQLFEINVHILKVIPKLRDVYNYLVGVKADRNYLNKKYIAGDYLVLGHTFKTKQSFNEGDDIIIFVEEVWRHKSKDGIHYSIHKPRVGNKINKVDGTDRLEDLVKSIGVEVIHSYFENMEYLEMDEKFITNQATGEGKEIEVKNFPNLMQEDFRNMIGKWNDYVMQVHTIGDSLHYDIRHKVNNHLQGITLFGRSIQDRLKIEEQKNNIRSTIKLPQPIDWLKFEGITYKGGMGATKSNPGVFNIISKGKFTISEVNDHVIRIEYKSDKGKISSDINNKAQKEGLEYPKDLPENLIDLDGKYSWTVNHIGDNYIMLFNKLKNE